MKRRWTSALSLALPLALVGFTQTACGAAIDECYDCGPCGISGGPYQDDALEFGVGADPSGVPTVGLQRVFKGKCKGDGVQSFWLKFENGATSLVPAPNTGTLNPDAASLAKSGNPKIFQFDGSALTVTIDRPTDHKSLRVTFKNGSTQAAESCTLSGETSVACTPDSGS